MIKHISPKNVFVNGMKSLSCCPSILSDSLGSAEIKDSRKVHKVIFLYSNSYRAN